MPQTSAPAPLTVNVPLVALAVPADTRADVLRRPWSRKRPEAGAAEAAGAEAVAAAARSSPSATLSNVAVASRVVSWLETPSPTCTSDGIAKVSLPTSVQFARQRT